MLSAQQILSAPVVACSEGDTPDDCTDVIGFIDIRDVLVSFLSGKLADLTAATHYTPNTSKPTVSFRPQHATDEGTGNAAEHACSGGSWQKLWSQEAPRPI